MTASTESIGGTDVSTHSAPSSDSHIRNPELSRVIAAKPNCVRTIEFESAIGAAPYSVHDTVPGIPATLGTKVVGVSAAEVGGATVVEVETVVEVGTVVDGVSVTGAGC
jgi:hypothetical protein